MDPQEQLHPAFRGNYYVFRRKVFKLFGGAFHVYDENGQVVLYSRQKAFKLKEDFRIYADEDQNEELLAIKTPQILDLGATYYVEDRTTGQTIGAIRRKALKSIVKDEWTFLSSEGREIGILTETSIGAALLSRFINLIPQSYVVNTIDGRTVAQIRQYFNPFVLKYAMTITDPQSSFDRRLLICAGIMLAGIEGRQQ